MTAPHNEPTVMLFFCATPAFAADNLAAVTFQMASVPDELSGRSIVATIGTGPSDANAVTVILNSLNQYREMVEVQPGQYYCTAAVQYDPTGDYPLTEENGTEMLNTKPGGAYTLTYEVSIESWFESVTGQGRFYTTVPVEQAPNDYDTAQKAQIAAYLTAPEGFDRHTVVYLENLYTGTVHPLDLYAANLLAAVNMDATAGKYAFVGGAVSGDAEHRFSFSCEGKTQTTEGGVNFHITVVDTQNPERTLTTPSRDQNEAVQQAETFNAEPTPAPTPDQTPVPAGTEVVAEPRKAGILSVFLDALPVAAVAAFLLWRRKQGR